MTRYLIDTNACIALINGSEVNVRRRFQRAVARKSVDPFNGDGTNYDVTQDGQRFVMVRPAADSAGSLLQLNVVVNWDEELKLTAAQK